MPAKRRTRSPSVDGLDQHGSARTQLQRASTSIHARTQAMHLRQSILREAIETSQFTYLHEVKGHRSCINALAFSRGSGQWMASGGDDMRIHIRDLYDYHDTRPSPPETSMYRTRARLLGHTSNIFSLAWSENNTHLFSGGNDQMVLCYDLNYDAAPIDTFQPRAERHMPDMSFSEHDAGIREVSAHPTNPSLVMTSSDAGQVLVVDVRLPRPHVAQSFFFPGQVASAQWNPRDSHTFAVTCSHDPHACAALYDVRQASHRVSSSDALVRYVSQLRAKLPAGLAMARPDPTGAQFDPSGRFLVTDMSLFHPTLYAVDNPMPLATMSSVAVHPHTNPCIKPDTTVYRPNPGYRNSCTVKRGSFGFEAQAGALYYTAGSDDFRGYGWRIPRIQDMLDARASMPYNDWIMHETAGSSEVWFRYALHGSDEMVRPVELAQPVFTLEGSNSIVNSTLCHPTMPMIATAGIERLVRLHYATPMSSDHLRREWQTQRPNTRQRPRLTNMTALLRAIQRRSRMPSDSDTETDEQAAVSPASRAPTSAELADQEAISLFDELLREEEGRSLFSHEDIDPDTDTDSDFEMQSIWDSESDMHVDLDALEFLLGPDDEPTETDEEDE